MALTLYTYPANYRAFKILIAAEYNGLDIEVPKFEMMKDNQSPEFLAMSPLGKVPVLKTPQGALFESNAIARYVARMRRDTELYGATFFESGQVDSWIDFCSHELELAATMWLYPVIGYMPYNEAATAKSKSDVTVALTTLEKYLADKTYLVGHKITLADITVASALVYPMKLLFSPEFRAPFPNVMRWFTTCVNQPQFTAVIGEVVLATAETLPPNGSAVAAAPAPAAAPAGKKGKGNAPTKGGGKGKPSPEEIARLKAEAAERKKNAPPKEKGPAEQPKKKKDKAPAADEPPKPKKEVHPLKALDDSAPSTLVGDVWKKVYSNCKGDYEGCMKQFWEMYDAEGWSIHTCRFKYNEENTQAFMTANATGGFVQRSGEIRKWLFGVMYVTGTEGTTPLEISGCYLIRGQDMEPLQVANDDTAVYYWNKVDTSTPEGKAHVAHMWCYDVDKWNNGEPIYLEGKLVNDVKQFK